MCSEKAACVGHVVDRDLAHAAAVPVDRLSSGLGHGQIGNAMHVANVGCVLVVALLAIDPVADT